jgi:oxygen-independent coproporphyrinogen-3 oxidase
LTLTADNNSYDEDIMKVYLANKSLEFDIKTYLAAHFPDETIEFESEHNVGCDFEFQISNQRAGLIYYEKDEIKYEKWLGKEHPLMLELSEENYDLNLYKKIVKHLIYNVAGNVIGRYMPWGILTGVRPTKLVYKLIKKYGKKRKVIAEILHKDYKLAKDKVSLLLDIVGFDGEIIKGIDEDGINIYIGIPFCPSKCAYCSFTTYPIDEQGKYKNRVSDYLHAMRMEMEYVGKHIVKDRPITSIYIGGGTPTSLDETQLESLLKYVTTIFDLKETKEFTVEAGRPDTVDIKKLKLLKNYGVNRISINPQTMNQETLDIIGRNHTTKDLEEAYYLAKSVGFNSINMDLIIGLPGESRIDVLNTLEQMWKFKPENITVHSLAVKKGSKISENQSLYHIVSALEMEEMLKMSRIQLELMGLKPYYMYRQKHTVGNFENVGYAREGFSSIYNIIMIEEVQTVIGIGSGSISKIIHLTNKGVSLERIENVKNLDDYINRIDEMIHRKKIVNKMNLYTVSEE